MNTAIADGVAEVAFDRPEKHNGLLPETFDALVATATALRDDPDVRAVLLRGEGKSFCAGLDFKTLAERGSEERARLIKSESGEPSLAQNGAVVWRTLEVPIVAALHGAVLGGGLQIALCADIRVCAPDAKLSFREISFGLVPDMGMSVTLPPLVSLDAAKRLILTGATISGTEAHALGLVTELSDEPLETARALAAEIAAQRPEAVRLAKRLLDDAWAGAPGRLAAERNAQRQLRPL